MKNYDKKAREHIEIQILGVIMLSKKEFNAKRIMFDHGIVSHTYFSTFIHQDIYKTMLICWEKDLETDLVTLSHEKPDRYKKENKELVNFDFYTVQCTQMIVANSDFEYNLWVLKQFIIMDFWNKKAEDIISNSWDFRDTLIVSSNIIEAYNALYESFTSGVNSNSNKNIKELAQEKYDKAQKGEVVAVKSGLKNLDDFCGGWHAPELSILAARPSMGKTSVAIASAKYSAYNQNKKGVFFSLEMSKKQLMDKIIASETDILYSSIKTFKTTPEEFQEILRWYDHFEKESLLDIYDVTEARTLSQIVRILREGNYEFAWIDYLQLIKMDKKMKSSANREQEVSEISRTLKLCCTELDMPINALSQLSRSVESRTNKRPILSDLRESGAIEQDADNVDFIYRDAYYQEQRDGANSNVPEIEKGNFELIRAKGRETGTSSFKNHINFKNFHLESRFLTVNDDARMKHEKGDTSVAPPPPE